MKRIPFAFSTLLTCLLLVGLTGCSRTIDDVANWKLKGNIEKLIKALEDPKVEVRIAATEALGELKAASAVNHVAALYNDSEEEIVIAAVNALASIGTDTTETPLIAALKLDYPNARKAAAVALGTIKATGAVIPLGEALSDTEAGVQQAAAVSLGQIGDEKGSDALVSKLNDGSSVELRKTCATSLGLTGGDAAAAGLIGALADENSGVAKAAVDSLLAIGKPSVDFAMDALKNETVAIRKGAIAVLRGLKAIPLTGNNFIWYQLARRSVEDRNDIDMKLVIKLVKMGDDGVDTLLEAVGHSSSVFREHATLALEQLGKSSLTKALAKAENQANQPATAWLNSRSNWHGAPAWQLDLWSALAALNPDFQIDEATATSLNLQGRAAFNIIISPKFKPTRAHIPLLISLLGDRTEPPPEQADYDADGIPIIKKSVDRFRGEANQQIAKEKLAASTYLATLPLIAAIEAKDDLIAGHAAQILGEQGDKRALKPLMKVVSRKLKENEQLTTSPFYTALQKMNEPAAEPLLLKVRPNSDRAMRVFERAYTDIRPMSSETKDEMEHHTQPVTFRLGYIEKGRVGEMMVTFAKDGDGNWIPNPPLPDQLPAY